jgi:hypothetical protein
MKKSGGPSRLSRYLKRIPDDWRFGLVLMITFTVMWLALETLLYKALNYFWG